MFFRLKARLSKRGKQREHVADRGGAVAVQVGHPAATGELAKYAPPPAGGAPTGAAARSADKFSFPAGLTKLVSTYCSKELAAPADALLRDGAAAAAAVDACVQINQ